PRKNVGRVQVIGWAYVTAGRTKDVSLGSRNLGGAHHGWGAPCNRHGAPMRCRDKRMGPHYVFRACLVYRMKAADARSLGVPVRASVKPNPRLGRNTTEAGFLRSVRRSLSPYVMSPIRALKVA